MVNGGFDGHTLQMFNTTSTELEEKFSILDLYPKQQRPKKHNTKVCELLLLENVKADESANIQIDTYKFPHWL
jgi:hypothetical protein